MKDPFSGVEARRLGLDRKETGQVIERHLQGKINQIQQRPQRPQRLWFRGRAPQTLACSNESTQEDALQKFIDLQQDAKLSTADLTSAQRAYVDLLDSGVGRRVGRVARDGQGAL